MISWNRDTALFIALTISAAVWLVLHLALSLKAARARALPGWLRFGAWLPPLTPIAGYASGARVRSALWCIVAVAYLVLRTRT